MAKRRVTSCAVVPRGSKVQICVRRPGEPGQQVSGPNDVCQLLRGAAKADRESFMTVYVDAQNKVVGVDETHKGSLTGVGVHPREVFKGALATNAAAVIIAHNHPSGSPSPSNDDLVLTRRLTESGELLGIPVLDHLIVSGESGCTSIREHNEGLFGTGNQISGDGVYPRIQADTGVTTITGMYRPKK